MVGNWWHVDRNSLKGEHRVGCRIGNVLQSGRQRGRPVKISCTDCRVMCSLVQCQVHANFVTVVDCDDPLLADNKGILINAEAGD